MASIIITLRDLVATRIAALKESEEFSNNDFELSATWFPFKKLEELPARGQVYVLGLAKDDERISRGNAYTSEIPVHLGLQKLLSDPRDTAAIDAMVELENELREAVRTLDDDRFAWIRTEALKDQNEIPFSYVGLREANVFEAYFTAFFKSVFE